MNTQVTTDDYVDEYPVQPWAQVVRTAAAAPAGTPAAAGFVPDAPVRRKARDRGASAVEWVIITGIVIVIVLGVGGVIASSLQDKAKSTGDEIGKATITGQ